MQEAAINRSSPDWGGDTRVAQIINWRGEGINSASLATHGERWPKWGCFKWMDDSGSVKVAARGDI